MIVCLLIGIDSFLKRSIKKNKRPEKKKRIPTPYIGGIPAFKVILIKYHVEPQIRHSATKGKKVLLFIN